MKGRKSNTIDWNNKDQVLAAVRRDWRSLEHVSQELKKDREVVLAALDAYAKSQSTKVGAHPLKFADQSLTSNKYFILEVVGKHLTAFEYASNELRKDREFVSKAIDQFKNSRLLRYSHDDLRGDRRFVLTQVEKDLKAFEHAGATLRNDRNFVLEALQINGLILERVQGLFKNDPEFVLAAVRQNVEALKYANAHLLQNQAFISEVLGLNGLALKHADHNLKNNEIVVSVAVGQNGLALEFADYNLKNNERVVSVAVGQNGLALQFAREELRGDQEIVLIAVGQNVKALRYASNELKEDPEFASSLLKQLKNQIEQARKQQNQGELERLLKKEKFLFVEMPLLRENYPQYLAPENKKEFAQPIINELIDGNKLDYATLSTIFNCRNLAGNRQEGVPEDYSEKLKETFENYLKANDISDQHKEEIKKFLTQSELFLSQREEIEKFLKEIGLFLPQNEEVQLSQSASSILPPSGLTHPGFHDAPLSGQEQPASSSEPSPSLRGDVAELAVARRQGRIKNQRL